MNDFEMEYGSAYRPEAHFRALGDWEGFDESFGSANSQVSGPMALGEAVGFLENEFDPDDDLEIAPAIAGILATAVPAVIKAVPGLIQAFKKQPRQKPAPRPASPVAVPTQSSPAPPVAAQSAAQPAAALLGLLQSPAVMSALQNLTAGAGSSISVGNTQIPLSSILGIVSQLASRAGAAFGKEDFYYPEYYFDTEGNILVNPESPENIAEHILNVINH
jgi:hypothetical protein